MTNSSSQNGNSPSNCAANDPLAIVVLAAGKGKRMGGDTPKVLCKTDEQALLGHVLDTTAELNPDKIVIVTGHGSEQVEGYVKAHPAYSSSKTSFALQREQRGTGDAVKAARESISEFVGTVLILYGDVPLVKGSTLKQLLTRHQQTNATLTVITFKMLSPNRYGRIARNSAGEILKIIEASECAEREEQLFEFNSGIYAVDSAFLFPALDKLQANNSQGEFYLTDILEMATSEGQTVSSLTLLGEEELQGANSPLELAQINRFLQNQRIAKLLKEGVAIIDPNSVYIGPQVKIASGVEIGPQVQLLGNCSISSGVKFEGCAWIKDCFIEQGAQIKFGVKAEGASIGASASVGPFAHLRSKSVLKEEVKVGNFVEVKNTTLEKGAKASHLTYLGDATVGSDANIGAGTITCNYDGYKKSQTEIGAGAFIGSNTSLVAPVKIGAGASIGAGSVITKDVEEDSLALTRAPLLTKGGWAGKKRAESKKK